jgi:hypothetical protein
MHGKASPIINRGALQRFEQCSCQPLIVSHVGATKCASTTPWRPKAHARSQILNHRKTTSCKSRMVRSAIVARMLHCWRPSCRGNNSYPLSFSVCCEGPFFGCDSNLMGKAHTVQTHRFSFTLRKQAIRYWRFRQPVDAPVISARV